MDDYDSRSRPHLRRRGAKAMLRERFEPGTPARFVKLRARPRGSPIAKPARAVSARLTNTRFEANKSAGEALSRRVARSRACKQPGLAGKPGRYTATAGRSHPIRVNRYEQKCQAVNCHLGVVVNYEWR